MMQDKALSVQNRSERCNSGIKFYWGKVKKCWRTMHCLFLFWL